MSNYSTGYNISQTGDLYAIQDHGSGTGLRQYAGARGTTVNAPVNYRQLKLFRNFDNEYFFFIKNQDRKSIFLRGMTINAHIVDRTTQTIVFSNKCITIDPQMGSCKLVMRSGDTANMDDGLYDLVISYTNEMGLTMPLYTDLNMRPNFTLEVTNEGSAQPIQTQVLNDFYDVIGDDYRYSQRIAGPAYYGKKAGLITLGVYTTGYSGKFFIQGTTAVQPEHNDWFDIDLGMMTYYYQFVNFDGIEPFNITSNLKYLRVKYEDNGIGTLDKVAIRV